MNDIQVTRMYHMRINRSLRQKDVEEMCGIPHTVYSAVETGRMSEPWNYVKEKLEAFYGMPLAELLEKVSLELT